MENKMNKKGIAIATLVTIIFTLIIGFILVLVAVKFGLLFSLQGEVESCRSSIVGMSKYREYDSGVSGIALPDRPISLNCPSHSVTFSSDSVKKGENILLDKKGKEELFPDWKDQDTPFLDDTTVMHVLSEEMYDCWYKMGEGKVNPFVKGKLDYDKTCMVCAYIRFDEGDIEKYNKGVGKDKPKIASSLVNPSAFENYLKNTKIPNDADERTYYDYLVPLEGYIGYAGEESDSVWVLQPFPYGFNEPLDYSKTYVLYFSNDRDIDLWAAALEVSGGADVTYIVKKGINTKSGAGLLNALKRFPKVLKKFGGKIIPGLGILLTAKDVYDVVISGDCDSYALQLSLASIDDSRLVDDCGLLYN